VKPEKNLLLKADPISTEGDQVAPANRKWGVLIAIGTGTFMSALDTSVVNTVLPVINADFGSQISTIQWVVTIYLLVVSGLLLTFGRLGDLRGHKSMYLLGFTIFIVSSGLCAWAPSAGALIGFRAVQAIGAAMLAANSPAILTENFPAVQRGQALGLQATMTYLGLTVAPSFGGWLTDLISWRMVFLINIPVGLLALMLSWYFIPADKHAAKEGDRFDLRGALLFMSGLIALLLGFNQGHSQGWDSPVILGSISGAVILLGCFIFVEQRRVAPMLDLSLFLNRVFSSSVISAILNYICIFGIMFLLPFYLIQGRGFSPSQAGLILTAQPIVMAIVAPISGSLSDRLGTRKPTTLGMALLFVGLFMMSRFDQQTPVLNILLTLVVTGAGTGTFISPNNSALMGSAPRNRQGIAAGILATSRSLGMVLGVGLSGAVFSTVLANNSIVAPQGLFFLAIQTSLLTAAAIAFLGVVVSSMASIRGE
jgi:EmrB/QacA subfamily drug resistance transporter